MNILYILGNGFDLAQGLKTSYSDFYDYLKKVPTKSDLEQRVIDEIESDYRSWADMEEALGKYTSKWKDSRDFLSVVSFLKVHLTEYLQGQNDAVSGMSLSTEKLLEGICFPEKFLFPKGRYIFNSSRFRSASKRDIRCVTFNYTNTFEQVLAPAIGESRTIREDGDIKIVFNGMMHIHGSLGGLTLLGVNDVEQMSNIAFRKNQKIIDEFVKPEINEACASDRNDFFEQWIREAEIIVLFGVSLGVTDNKWWQTIGDVFNSKPHYARPFVFYFPFDLGKNTKEFETSIRGWSNDYISLLRQRFSLSVPENEVKERILIGINSDIFDLKDE